MDAQERYDEIVEDLARRYDDVVAAKMMGMPAIKARGKLVGGFFEGAMVFKLPDEDERDRALGLVGTQLFDPSGRGRPMKEWVQVPFAHVDVWVDLAERAVVGPV
jgi:hypothetical protein